MCVCDEPVNVFAPCPASWGLRLGIRVASIRSIGRYVRDQPERVEALEVLGFEWALREGGPIPAASSPAQVPPLSPQGSNRGRIEPEPYEGDPSAVSFDAMMNALNQYVAIVGDANVPVSFVVPNAEPWPISCRSLPLGSCLNQISTRGAYLSTRAIRAQLSKEKFGAKGATDDAELEELEGAAAKAVEQRIHMLVEAGYTVKTQGKEEPISMSRRFERLVAALGAYRVVYGNLDVPQHFAVPESPDWPEEVWGLRLGSRVNAIRSQGTFVKNNPARRELLSEMGFRWETEAGMRSRVHGIVEGQGSVQGWQARKWASGREGTSGNPYYKVFGEEAPGDGTEDDYVRAHTFDDVVAALRIWQGEFGETENIPVDFEVPLEGELRGVEIELEGLRTPMAEDVTSEAEAGMSPNLDEFNDDEIDLSALGTSDDELLAGLFGGDDGDGFGSRSPLTSLMPAPTLPLRSAEEIAVEAVAKAEAVALLKRVNGLVWPRKLGGLPLGPFVAQLRSGDARGKLCEERRPKLDAIGFTWGDESKFLHFNYERMVDALGIFVKIFGDMCVSSDFVVPASDLWDEHLHGFELGRAVNLCRAQREVVRYEYPQRYQLLSSFSFLWLPSILVDHDEAADTVDASNFAAVAEVQSMQRDYEAGRDWATNFYENLLSPSEWVRLRSAMEKGFVWEGGHFGLDEMYEVEAAHPDEEPLELDEDDDFDEEAGEDENYEVGDDNLACLVTLRNYNCQLLSAPLPPPPPLFLTTRMCCNTDTRSKRNLKKTASRTFLQAIPRSMMRKGLAWAKEIAARATTSRTTR